MYIRSDLAHNERKDLQHPALESVWVEVLLPRTKPFLVGTCYRPPKQMDLDDHIEQCCVTNERFLNMEVIMMGDFNTNVARLNNNSGLVKKLKDFCNSCNLSQLI